MSALSAAAAVSTAAVIATAAPASADPNGGKFTTVYSLANGPCVAIVDTSVNGNAYPGAAAFTVGANLLGVGPCSLPITLNWRNLDNGQAGSFTQIANGPGFWGNSGPGAIFNPGYGNFAATVSVAAPHIPESGELRFTVQPYQG
ncbi:hypothetical protein [Nocardia transvalensis]|uniref:hypothetical protein n=1 Tax=Nocardia transvalensis TaxID=37333 RepID=UPI002B4AAFFC|nr:hypothetical protein [Nocardia transvalensis]